jgi:hypothetical protein
MVLPRVRMLAEAAMQGPTDSVATASARAAPGCPEPAKCPGLCPARETRRRLFGAKSIRVEPPKSQHQSGDHDQTKRTPRDSTGSASRHACHVRFSSRRELAGTHTPGMPPSCCRG